MIIFLAGILEQLDLAVEHISKGDDHNARFGLMMTDNALELVLHQIVKDKRSEAAGWRHREKPYEHEAKLKKAFLGSFPNKIEFAKVDAGMTPPHARTFNIMHEYRNEIYHAGLTHEAILLPLTKFYFAEACGYIGTYRPRGLGWASGQKMPERAQKYFTGDRGFPAKGEDFPNGCAALRAAVGHDIDDLVGSLAADYERIVDHTDTCLQIIADGVYEGQKLSRDQAILQTQAWDVAFDDAGKTFLRERGFKGSMMDAIKTLEADYPFRFRKDPIPGWQSLAKKLGTLDDGNVALDRYHTFVKQTGALRGALDQGAAAAEAEIEAAMDRMRGR
jgi:hypothetical protein